MRELEVQITNSVSILALLGYSALVLQLGVPAESRRPNIHEQFYTVIATDFGDAGMLKALYPILIGQARRWTLTSPGERSASGRSMLAKRGGYAVQQMYREQGRTGEKHPSQKAAKVSVQHRKRTKELKQEAEQRERLGLGPKPRTAYLPIG